MSAPRSTVIVHAAFLVLLGWFYGGDLLDAARVPGAEVSALTEPPSALFAGAVLLFTAIALGIAVGGALRGRGRDFKGYRLLPVIGVVALFVDVFAISAQKLPMSASDQLGIALEQLRMALEERSSPQAGVVTEEAILREEVARLGSPPLLVRGVRPAAWGLQVRRECDGPVTEAPGVQAGTILYCASADRRRAWLTAVAFPVGQKFGAPALLRRGDELLYGVIDVTNPFTEDGELALPEVPDAGSPAPR